MAGKKIKEIAGKTDSAVKTAESWWSFGREAYQMLGATLAVAGFITTGAVKVWQSALAVGWEYYALIGPPVFLFTLLAVSFVHMKMVLWKRTKTFPEVVKKIDDAPLPPLSKSSLEEILVRISALESAHTKENDSIATVENRLTKLMGGLDARIHSIEKETSDKIQKLTNNAAGFEARMDSNFEKLKADNHRSLDALHQRRKSEDAIRFGEIAEILDAKSALKLFNNLTQEIDDSITVLAKIPLDENWGKHYKNFKWNLKKWDTFKNDYKVSQYANLFDVRPEQLKSSEWTDEVNNLPPDDGLEFKHYRISAIAYLSNREQMRTRITNMANKSLQGHSASSYYVNRFLD